MPLADFHVPEPTGLTQPYAALFWSVVVAVVFMGGPLVVFEVRRSRQHRADEAARERQAKADLKAAQDAAPDPAVPVAPRFTESATQPPQSMEGRHAAPGFAEHRGNVGRHFADTDSPTREIRRDWSWRA